MTDPRALAARLLAKSRYAMPRADALAHIEARRRTLLAALPEPEPDFTVPEPLTIIDAPEKFAEDFWKRRASPPNPPKPNGQKRPGRRPRGGDTHKLGPGLRVVDGGLDGDKGEGER